MMLHCIYCPAVVPVMDKNTREAWNRMEDHVKEAHSLIYRIEKLLNDRTIDFGSYPVTPVDKPTWQWRPSGYDPDNEPMSREELEQIHALIGEWLEATKED